MSPQFLLVWVSLSWISSHWNQVSYLNKHTHIMLKERKLGEGYLFRILLFYLLKGKYWTLPCPHLILPAVDLARDGGTCPLSLRCLSPHHAHSSGRSQDVCPDAVGAWVPARVCYPCCLPAAGFPDLTGRMGYSDRKKVVVISVLPTGRPADHGSLHPVANKGGLWIAQLRCGNHPNPPRLTPSTL